MSCMRRWVERQSLDHQVALALRDDNTYIRMYIKDNYTIKSLAYYNLISLL